MKIIIKGFLLILFTTTLSFSQSHTLSKDTSGLVYIVHEGIKDGPIVILIHGYGSNEQDLFNIYKYFPFNTTVVCPRGPIKIKSNSYSWYDIAFKKDGNHERNTNQAEKSDSLLVALSKNMKVKYGSDSTKIIFGGFSQGAIMSFKITLDHPELVNGFIGLSGAPLHQNFKATHSATTYNHIKAFYAHGLGDPVLKYNLGLQCKTIMDELNMSLSFHSYDMGHQVIQQELIDLSNWFRKYF